MEGKAYADVLRRWEPGVYWLGVLKEVKRWPEQGHIGHNQDLLSLSEEQQGTIGCSVWHEGGMELEVSKKVSSGFSVMNRPGGEAARRPVSWPGSGNLIREGNIHLWVISQGSDWMGL